MEDGILDVAVLYVEDDPLTRKRLAEMLRREVRTVFEAENGLEGLRIFAEKTPDIIITDIRMPAMSGLKMVAEIRKSAKDVFIIVTTAHGETEFLLEAIEMGISNYVLKPVDWDKLYSALVKCVEVIELMRGKKRFEEEMKKTNERLETRVRERTRELEDLNRELTTEISERKRVEEERERLIEELKKALDAVSISRKDWQDTFDSIGDMIAIIDRDFSIMKSNISFAEYVGASKADLAGHKCYDLLGGTSACEMNCPHNRTLESGKAATEELRDLKRNRVLRVSTFPYYSMEGEISGSIHISRDVTDEKEKEMKFIMSDRLAALGQMASGIAHEINNPLSSIAGCSEGLLSRVKKGLYAEELFEKYLGIIQEEIVRCKDITTSMLSFIRSSTHENSSVNLNQSLDRALELIGFQGRLKEIEIVKKYDPFLPLFFCREGDLRQVFIVIITNALDAMEDKGTLTVETASGPGELLISLGDTGKGIPEAALARIFDAYYTTRADNGGTGLGLSIAHKIIAGYKGRIEVAPQNGAGTIFRIHLPAE